MPKKLYESYDRRFWVERQTDELYNGYHSYRARLAHVITLLYYKDDDSAKKSVKQAKRNDDYLKRRIWR